MSGIKPTKLKPPSVECDRLQFVRAQIVQQMHPFANGLSSTHQSTRETLALEASLSFPSLHTTRFSRRLRSDLWTTTDHRAHTHQLAKQHRKSSCVWNDHQPSHHLCRPPIFASRDHRPTNKMLPILVCDTVTAQLALKPKTVFIGTVQIACCQFPSWFLVSPGASWLPVLRVRLWVLLRI